MDKVFFVHANWEENEIYYIDTDYGQLNTTNKKEYEKVVKDGWIIIKLPEEDIVMID